MIEINCEKLYEDYVGKLDKEILPSIDYDLLQASYKTEDKLYAKEVLKKLHEGFVEVYQTHNLDSYEYDFVLVPAVIKCQNTGEICIGLVELDISSSGEHWGTTFLTKYGIADQGNEKLPKHTKDFISSHYMPYNYWYMVEMVDHHVDFDEIPDDVADLINFIDKQENNITMGGL